jgi:small conductance mechanosensitive channel
MIQHLAPITALTPEQLWTHYGEAATEGAFKVLAALAILIAGLWITGWFANAVRRLVQKSPRIDTTLGAFFASFIRFVLMAIVLIAVLDQFGVQTTQIVAVLGAATLAIGLALQGTLSNVAAGVMLIMFRPYRIGDFVELAGRRGTVRDINIFITELATPDNVKVTLPNGQCWGAPIMNFTANGTRMADLTFNVAYDTDIDRAIALLRETVKADPRTHPSPEPLARVTALGEYAVSLQVIFWCEAASFIGLRFDLNKAVKHAFDAAGIKFPLPTNVTYEYQIRQ